MPDPAQAVKPIFIVRRKDGSHFESPVPPPSALLPQPPRKRTAVVDEPAPESPDPGLVGGSIVRVRPTQSPVGYTPPDATGTTNGHTNGTVTKAKRPADMKPRDRRIAAQREGTTRPVKFSWEWAENFIRIIREGNFRSTAARLTGQDPDTVKDWLQIGKAAGKGDLYQLYLRVNQAEAAYEVTAVKYVTNSMRLDASRALQYLKIRHPERFAERQQVTVRPGKPDRRVPEGEDTRGPETLDEAQETLSGLTTDGVLDLYEKAFGEFSPEEREGIVGLDQEGAGVRRPEESRLS